MVLRGTGLLGRGPRVTMKTVVALRALRCLRSLGGALRLR